MALDAVCQDLLDIGCRPVKQDPLQGARAADEHLIAVAVVNIKYAVHVIERATGIRDPWLTVDQRNCFSSRLVRDNLGQYEAETPKPNPFHQAAPGSESSGA